MHIHRRAGHLCRLHAATESHEEVGPAVVHEVLGGDLEVDHGQEVVHPLALPAGRQVLEPLRVGRPVVARRNGRRCALEDDNLVGMFGQFGHDLYSRRARSDHADALVCELGHATLGAPAGVLVVPTRRVKHLALEIEDALDAGQLDLRQRSLADRHESGAEFIAAVGRHQPAFGIVVPFDALHLGLEQGLPVQLEVAREPL